MSFDEDKLVENVHAFVEQIKHVKPASVKGHYIKSVTLSATMSPGVPLQV
jgi:large subunit ribosomal protein L1